MPKSIRTDEKHPVASNGIRIFRAIDKVDGVETTADFLVPAAFLAASEVLEVMGGDSDGVMTSDDNVIPFHDPVRNVELLVAWMTRAKGFEIDDDNMKILALMADKYIIESLHKDIENYTRAFTSPKASPSLDLWLFASRYNYIELEECCRANEEVFGEIKALMGDPSKGIDYLVNTHRISLPVLGKTIYELVKGHNVGSREIYCYNCRKNTSAKCSCCDFVYTVPEPVSTSSVTTYSGWYGVYSYSYGRKHRNRRNRW